MLEGWWYISKMQFGTGLWHRARMSGWPSGLRCCGLITVRLLGSSAWVRIPLLSKIYDLYQQMHKTDSFIVAHLHSISYPRTRTNYPKLCTLCIAGRNKKIFSCLRPGGIQKDSHLGGAPESFIFLAWMFGSRWIPFDPFVCPIYMSFSFHASQCFRDWFAIYIINARLLLIFAHPLIFAYPIKPFAPSYFRKRTPFNSRAAWVRENWRDPKFKDMTC